MIRHKVRNASRMWTSSAIVVLVLVFVASLIAPIGQQAVEANTIQQQLNALAADNAQSRAIVNNLEAEAGSYQQAIDNLQARISGLQSAIEGNQARQADLQRQIAEAKAEIERQRSILAEDVKAMYVDGTPSSFEIFAASKSMSEYLDKQEYRSRVQNKLQETMRRIAALEKQLQQQKAEVEQLIAEQKAQQDQLAVERGKQQELLAMNQAQREAYSARISSNSQRMNQLRQEQAALIRQASAGARIVGNSGNDTYPSPWRNAPLNAYVDSWGMFSRQCVSYTAWKVHEAYGNMPTWGFIYRSNANDWDDLAASASIPTGYTPKAGSVGIINAGTWGHAVWIEAVEGSQVLVSEYNYDWAGGFRRAYYPASSFIYIYFGEWRR